MAYYSNSTEGAVFYAQCAECVHGMSEDILCPIAAVQSMFNYDQNRDQNLKACLSMLVDQKKGCLMKPIIDDIKINNVKPKCLQRKLVFGDEQQIDALEKLARR